MSLPPRLHYVSHAAVPSGEANSVQVVKMCAAFAPHFEQVTLYGRETETPAEQTYSQYGVPPSFSMVRIPNRRVKFVSRALYSWRQLRALGQSGSPGLLYGRDYHTLALSVMSASPSWPIVLEAHQPPGNALEYFLMKRLLSSRRLVRLVVISQALADHFVHLFGDAVRGRVTVVHDGADEPTGPVPPRAPSGGGLQVGYVGSLYPGKGMERIEDLAPRMPEATFHVVGGKPADLERWRARLTSKNVRFHGFRPHAEAQELMRGFDVLLAPYARAVLIGGDDTDIGRWMSPLKIFEYMGSGRPMIVSDLPVIREVLEDGRNALLADPEDSGSWVARLHELANDPSLARSLTEAAHRDLVSHYTWDRRAARIVEDLRGELRGDCRV